MRILNHNIFLLLLFMLSTLRAATFIVDTQHPQADDTNPGTLLLPWATISHAVETAIAGDSVLIRTGTYHEHIVFANSGSSENGPIVYSGYKNEIPIVDGTDVQESQNGIIIDKDYIVLQGLEIQNWQGNGIWITHAANTILNDCEVHDITFGIGVSDGSHDFQFNRVEVHHFTFYGFDVSPSGGADCYNGTFNNCIAHTGNDPEQNVDGFALGHGSQHHFTFNHCITYNVYDGFDISSAQSTLNACLAYNCGNGCYKLWQDQLELVNCIGYNGNITVVELDWDGEPGKSSLTNCTFFNSGTFTIWIENAADTLNMHNCIVAGGDNIGLAFEQPGIGNYIGDYNLFQNDNPSRAIAVAYSDEFSISQLADSSWNSYSGQDAHSLTTEMDTDIFMAPADNNLHLGANSPALDSGTSVGAPEIDFDGKARPVENGYDMGAFEYGLSTGIKNTENTTDHYSLFGNYPNPFNATTRIQFNLPKSEQVQLTLYNIRGNKIRTLINKQLTAGQHTIQWNGLDDQGNAVASGIYFCKLECANMQQVIRMILEK